METMVLLGAEDVSRAAGTIRGAALEMQSAASAMQHAFDQHEQFLINWLAEFTAALQRAPRPGEAAP